jgi:hypothetical protein
MLRWVNQLRALVKKQPRQPAPVTFHISTRLAEGHVIKPKTVATCFPTQINTCTIFLPNLVINERTIHQSRLQNFQILELM